MAFRWPTACSPSTASRMPRPVPVAATATRARRPHWWSWKWRNCWSNSHEPSPFRDRDIEQVDPIERAVLRIAAYELRERRDVPYRVVINEAIETVKRFGSEHGHTYVNGVLDHAAVAWRPVEVQAARPR